MEESQEKVYSKSPELQELAEKLIEKYYLYLGHVQTDNIYFAEISGSKPKKAAIMQIGGISSAWVKQLIMKNNCSLYCISVWGEEWIEVSPVMQEWMMFDALLRVDVHNDGKLRKPDVNEFGMLVEYIGPYWRERSDLPMLLGSDEPLPIPLPKDNNPDEGKSFDDF